MMARLFIPKAGLFAVVFATVSVTQAARADDSAPIAVTLQDHRFSPAEIAVPAGKPVVLVVTNKDATPEEFDSTALKVEKVIAGGTYGTIRIRPLGPGRYPFMGEYHADMAQGAITSK